MRKQKRNSNNIQKISIKQKNLLFWNSENEKKSWLNTVPAISKTNLDSLIKLFSKYHKYGLNIDGISEALMNIVIRYNLASDISIMRQKIPRIRKALQKAHALASTLKGDDFICALSSSIGENLKYVDQIEERYKFYDKEMIRKGKKVKRPPLEDVHLLEGELISYFHETGYCESASQARCEVLQLIKYVGHLISSKQLKDIYENVKKLPYFFGSKQIHNCPTRFNPQN